MKLGPALALGIALAVPACSSNGNRVDAPPAPCSDIAIDRFKEMEIVDEAVVSDPRSSNAKNGEWSFRHVMEELTPSGMAPSDFTYAWLSSWRSEAHINTFVVPGRKRIDNVLLCPWLLRTPLNNCNADCSTCTSHELDLTSAPFRLIALANRIDLRETAGTPEARLVFALTNGPADDPASQPMFMTLIAEYAVVGVSAKDWAAQWHALGKHAAFDEAYRVDLAALFARVVPRGSTSSRGSWSALAQLRTNEREFDWQWDFRQFELAPTGLHQVGTANTPDRSLNGTDSALRTWIIANQEAILSDKHVLPKSFTGGIVTPAKWNFPKIDDSLRGAFARSTCDGCHQLEASSIDTNFQVSPFRKGVAKLAPFLNDPASPTTDALSKRAASMQRALCEH